MKLQDIEDEMEREYIRLCIQESEVVKSMRYLTIYYKYMIKNNKGDINYWLDLVRESPLRLNGLKSLANGIQMDIKAVTNAIKTDWSNGRVEGHVNRIKMIKRQMYGRAGFKLLRIKILLSA